MAANYWAKLFIEMLDDRKTASLPDSSWRRFVECILLAKELNEDGYLPPVIDMAWRLRLNPEALDDDLTRLALAGLLERRENDRWFVTNFSKRQDKMTDAERSARYRESKRKTAYSNNAAVTDEKHSRNEPVTEPSRIVTQRREEKRREEAEVARPRENPPPKSPISSSPFHLLQEHFVSRKGIHPNDRTGTYERDWKQPLEAFLAKAGGDVTKAAAYIDAALDIAAGNNDRGQTYTVSSPRSLAVTIANLPAEPDAPSPTPDSIWQRVTHFLNANQAPDEPRLLAAVRAVGWQELRAADDYSLPRLKAKLFQAYRSVPA